MDLLLARPVTPVVKHMPCQMKTTGSNARHGRATKDGETQAAALLRLKLPPVARVAYLTPLDALLAWQRDKMIYTGIPSMGCAGQSGRQD